MMLNIVAIENKIDNLGHSAVYVSHKAKAERAYMFLDDDTHDKAMDFIFGRSEDNPFENITEEQTRRNQEIQDETDTLIEMAKKVSKKKKMR